MALATSLWRESLPRSRFIHSMRSFTSGAMSLAARRHALLGRAAVDGALQREDGVELLNRLESDRRDRRRLPLARFRSDVGKLEQLASRMRPAAGFRDRSGLSIRRVERIEPRIGIGLKDPGIAGEMLLGMDAGAIRRVEEHGGRRRSAAERTIITHIGPNPSGAALALRQHRHRGVVAMKALSGEHMRLDQLVERHQRRRTGADMIRHGRHRQLDPLARILLALPVERLMVGVLLDQHHCQEARTREAARDRVERRRRLRDRLARAAAELLPHMLGHEPLPRHHIERLGYILADLGKLAAATTGAARWRRVHDPPTRQIGGKVASRRLAPREALHLDACRLCLGLVLSRCRGQLLKLQLQLIDEPLAALGARTELLALHLRDHQLQVLDQSLRAHQLGARLDQRRLQRISVVGNMISGTTCRDTSIITLIRAINRALS